MDSICIDQVVDHGVGFLLRNLRAFGIIENMTSVARAGKLDRITVGSGAMICLLII